MDVTAVTTAIAALDDPINAIGAAVLLIFVVLKGWKYVRRAF